MKNQFNRFALRFLTVILLGLLLLCLRGRSQGAVTAILAPRFASPWELSKLAYWPLLAGLLLIGRLPGAGLPLRAELKCLVLTPLALFLAFWGVSVIHPAAGVYLLLWIVAAALSLALADQGKEDSKGISLWLVLAIALGVFYILFSLMPPMAGPFLDPTDVAAMATIPY